MMSELHESADRALAVELLWRWASAGIVVHVHSQHSEERLLGLSRKRSQCCYTKSNDAHGVSGNSHTRFNSFLVPKAVK